MEKMEIEIKVADILHELKSGKRYRVLSLFDKKIVVCEMDITKLCITQHEISTLLPLIIDKSVTIEKENPPLFDESLIPKSTYEKFLRKRGAMHRLVKEFWPSFVGLTGKSSKPAVRDIMAEYELSVDTFWRLTRAYLQSGMRDAAIVDARFFGNSKGKKYQYETKPGRSAYIRNNVSPFIDEETKAFFEEALEDYKSGRQKTVKSAYDNMNLKHYLQTEIGEGGQTVFSLKPISERPTLRQFYYYVEKHLSQEEKDAIKTSAAEQRNDKRLLLSDSLNGVYGPGDMVEIDACEADVSLVSTSDKNKTVGRPVVYFMIDVYSKAIIAASVAFDNNSVLGVTNLLLNLADDKQELCARYGLTIDSNAFWPSNIIPRRLRVDRGSEFKSKEFGRICNELGIEKDLVPGASGSLKGLVEQSFHQMHSHQKEHLENYGYIEKRYDSEHHKEATLNIEQYTKMVINFVLDHNRRYNKDYRLTKEMRKEGVAPIPAALWEYGVKTYGPPRPITGIEQYCYNLMRPVKAKIDRRGILYKGLYYLQKNDPVLLHDMFKAGTKKIPFEVRMDMRHIGAVYYIRDQKLMVAPLNPNITGNAEFANLTMKEWDDYRKDKSALDAKGRVYNEELSAFSRAINVATVDSAKKTQYSDSTDMRPARETEKQEISSQGRMIDRLPSVKKQMTDKPLEESIIPDEKEAEEISDTPKEPESMEDEIRRLYGWDV